MFRRSFLGALSAASSPPLIPDRLGSDRPPELPSEPILMFWYHFLLGYPARPADEYRPGAQKER